MYDPYPTKKDIFFQSFEDLLKNHAPSAEDEKRREEIQQQLADMGNTVSSDK